MPHSHRCSNERQLAQVQKRIIAPFFIPQYSNPLSVMVAYGQYRSGTGSGLFVW
ncbi:hypothetical protein [Xenorhabdus mauleonii]|uniref:hypothetical protein n=1 Tax=Xenorhabdus mauleonii TaxID=351675 RepID=UPI0015874D29|nr:hypothetical protein [Xenorhabdus mauleonii]